ncbi:hypothetical protein BIV60_01430 [Bacillus sp. MUM 116]|uniref:prepilin-type N-terminal cleavage/methylation domain-containing protein n=1 Tax=Bacillus sp. MUM 116 TaxID=1678002 RepID=UPI0008F57F37|nr:prepilin-type N-terminal cleavage/methylation domain-containing protein [Bacillus sp. MUM 116]OIK16966.1 hypothetical protein BIV60_01430 [Bacillus sp. MUM 116]
MIQKLKKKLKEQQGMTLVELLAVIVILGIIAAIAIPSIGKLIDNSKLDAHVANASQVISSTQLAVTNEPKLQLGTKYIPLEYLEATGVLDKVKDPDSVGYSRGNVTGIDAVVALNAAPATSYVKVVDGKVMEIRLFSTKRGVQDDTGKAIGVDNITRNDVHDTK